MVEKVVELYSTPTCPWCKRAKEYLSEKGVKFTDYNVAEDSSKLQEMVSLTGQRGVPVIRIDNEIIVGFNPASIDKALGI
jgi:glutaredoxin 3